jgi:hypothetical protein
VSENQYRTKAAACHARAESETCSDRKALFENLSLAYLRLAEQADRNASTEIVPTVLLRPSANRGPCPLLGGVRVSAERSYVRWYQALCLMWAASTLTRSSIAILACRPTVASLILAISIR